MSLASRRLYPRSSSVFEHPDLLARMFNAIPDAMLVFDGSGRIRFGNASAGRMLGVEASHLPGLDLQSLVAYDARDAVASQCAEYFAAPSTVPFGDADPWRLLPRDGVPVTADLGLSATRVDGRLLAIAVLRPRAVETQRAAA